MKVKCGENGLSIAERQSMHVASVAANAIVELFKDRAVSRVKELDREILVFSVSHDHVNVKIHGHYARIEEDKITLHRHLMREFGLRDQNGKEKWTTYHVVRKIYDYFAPIHLERIRGAIAQLSIGSSFGMSSASLGSNSRGDKETESDSQETAEGAPSSQDTDRPKKARLKPTAMLQKENDWLKKDREDQKRQIEFLLRQAMPPPSNASTTEPELQRLNAELERQRQDNELLRQNANSGNDSEVVTMLRQELDRQRQESTAQLEKQRQESKEQMSKLMETLQPLSAQPKQKGRK